jgi:hypothetical protein
MYSRLADAVVIHELTPRYVHSRGLPEDDAHGSLDKSDSKGEDNNDSSGMHLLSNSHMPTRGVISAAAKPCICASTCRTVKLEPNKHV